MSPMNPAPSKATLVLLITLINTRALAGCLTARRRVQSFQRFSDPESDVPAVSFDIKKSIRGKQHLAEIRQSFRFRVGLAAVRVHLFLDKLKTGFAFSLRRRTPDTPKESASDAFGHIVARN